jgi:predicted amidohydrolase YtcJ
MSGADLVIHGGTVISPLGDKPDTVVVLNGKITAVGRERELSAFCGSSSEVLDTRGATVLPGLRDSHLHLLNYGMMLTSLNLIGTKSIEEIGSRIRAYIQEKKVPPGKWIRGRGWNQQLFAVKRLPSESVIASFAPHNPLYLERVCGHVALLNSLGLKCLNFDRFNEGEIQRDGNGSATGIVFGSAIQKIRALIPAPDMDEYESLLSRAVHECLNSGLTELHTEDRGVCRNVKELSALYQHVWHKEGLRVRINHELLVNSATELLGLLEDLSTVPKHEKITMNTVKVLLDGSLGARTASFFEPYVDMKDDCGSLYLSGEELISIVETAHTAGMQVAAHAIGDKAAQSYLDAFASFPNPAAIRTRRHRMIHCQFMTPRQWQKMRRFGMVGDIQPRFVASDWSLVAERRGNKRASYAWRSMRKAGIPLAGGSDCPVEPVDPLLGMHCAMTRQDLSGYPEGGFYREEALSPREALDLFSVGPAYAAFGEKTRGVIAPGMDADLTIVEGDYNRDPVLVCLHNSVRYTVCCGKLFEGGKNNADSR